MINRNLKNLDIFFFGKAIQKSQLAFINYLFQKFQPSFIHTNFSVWITDFLSLLSLYGGDLTGLDYSLFFLGL